MHCEQNLHDGRQKINRTSKWDIYPARRQAINSQRTLQPGREVGCRESGGLAGVAREAHTLEQRYEGGKGGNSPGRRHRRNEGPGTGGGSVFMASVARTEGVKWV